MANIRLDVVSANIVKVLSEKEYQTQKGDKRTFFMVNIATERKVFKENKEEKVSDYSVFKVTAISDAQAQYYRNLFKPGNHVSIIGGYFDGVANAYQKNDGSWVSGSLQILVDQGKGSELVLWEKKDSTSQPQQTAPAPVTTPAPAPTPAPQQAAPTPAPAPQQTAAPAPQQSETAYQSGGAMPWDD